MKSLMARVFTTGGNQAGVPFRCKRGPGWRKLLYYTNRSAGRTRRILEQGLFDRGRPLLPVFGVIPGARGRPAAAQHCCQIGLDRFPRPQRTAG
jgi:hypothetical protein